MNVSNATKCVKKMPKISDENITKSDLIELLIIATKNQHFQFEGINLYEQVYGVAIGSPLGPLMANPFMCKIEHETT